MRILLLVPLAYFLFVAAPKAYTQSAIAEVDPKVAAIHLQSSPAPEYPPIAKAAHISGTVVFEIVIGPTGKVINIKSLSGPNMLYGAAMDAVKQWKYLPFDLNGTPASVKTKVSVPFVLDTPDPDDRSIADKFFPLSDACHKAVLSHADPKQQADDCAKAAEQAEKFSTSTRYIERRSAFVYASSAYRHNHQPQLALEYADKAVKVVAQGQDDGSGSSAAYSVRAQAEVDLGSLSAADQDLDKAEDFEKKAIDDLKVSAPELVQHEYVPQLKGMLNFHSQLLIAAGKNVEAKAKSDEAAKL
jgi:TonB family protein